MIGTAKVGGGSGLIYNGALVHILAPTGEDIQILKNNVVIKTIPSNESYESNIEHWSDYYWNVRKTLFSDEPYTIQTTPQATATTLIINQCVQYDVVLNARTDVITNGSFNNYITPTTFNCNYTENYRVNNETYVQISSIQSRGSLTLNVTSMINSYLYIDYVSPEVNKSPYLLVNDINTTIAETQLEYGKTQKILGPLNLDQFKIALYNQYDSFYTLIKNLYLITEVTL